ncbi:hypothetical protein BC830DRAFT_1158337, partial [Chytriomyces sp. MP71]
MIQLNTTTTQGRFLTTTEAIAEARTSVLRAQAYAHTVLASHRKRACAACLAMSARALPLRCKDCDQLFFCDESCFNEAISNGHARVCGSLRRIATAKIGLHEKSIAQIALNVLLRRTLEAAKREQIQISTLLNPTNPLTSSAQIADALIKNPLDPIVPSYKDVQSLQSHLADWTNDTRKEWRKTCALMQTLVTEAGLVDASLVDESEGDTLEYILLHLFSKIESNGFGVWAQKMIRRVETSHTEPFKESESQEPPIESIESLTISHIAANRKVSGSPNNEPGTVASDSEEFNGVDDSGICIGRAIYPFASYFNHSCDPTCESVQYGPILLFQTTRPLQENEELTISYMNTNAPVSSRRAALFTDYYFDCACTRCVTELKMKPGERSKVSFARSFVKKPSAAGTNRKKGRKGEVSKSTTVSDVANKEVNLV